ncbi:aspartate/glutamate racemase family protein [candidate division KSB1 bacterium]
MFLKRHKVIGIMGGMGPDATIDFYNHILSLTPAEKDQDHYPALIYSNPKIPDRTESIASGETGTIIEYLQETTRILEKGGADFIAIPCNTAHQFYDEIVSSVRIPVLHIVEEAVKYIITRLPGVRIVGLLGTTGTLNTGLYQGFLQKNNIEAITVESKVQESLVMKAIYSIKAGKTTENARELLVKAIATLPVIAQEVVVMGCTEIPLAFREPLKATVLINPTKILAESALRMCTA